MDNTGTSREQWPALMARAQAGDHVAYTQLLKALVPVIRSLVRKQIADEVLMDDVIQDVLLTLHRIRHTYSPEAPFLPWLMAITHARAVDALRRRGRYQQREVDASDPEDHVLITPQEADGAQDELALLLNQLPARQREVVEQIHLREMSLSETASHNNLTVAAVKSLLHRALSNLRRLGAHHGRS